MEQRPSRMQQRLPGSSQLARPRGDSLADLLERVLDKGVVVAGDIVVNLLDIELLTLKMRLLICSADTAQQMGIDWWKHDPFLTGSAAQQQQREDLESGDTQQLRERIERLEASIDRLELGGGQEQQKPGVPKLISQGGEGGARSKAKGALSGAGESISNALGGGGDDDQSPGLMDRAREGIGERLGGDERQTAENPTDREDERALPQSSERSGAWGPSSGRAPQEERRPPQRRRAR